MSINFRVDISGVEVVACADGADGLYLLHGVRLAAVGGISYDYMRKLIRVSPWDWPSPVREKICKALGVKAIRGVEGMPLQEAIS